MCCWCGLWRCRRVASYHGCNRVWRSNELVINHSLHLVPPSVGCAPSGYFNIPQIPLGLCQPLPRLAMVSIGCYSGMWALPPKTNCQGAEVMSCTWQIVVSQGHRAQKNQHRVQAIIYAPNSLKLVFDNCPKLETVIIWSEQVTSLVFDGCTGIKKLQYRCEKVEKVDHPPLVPPEKAIRPAHPPLRDLVSETYKEALHEQSKRKDTMLRLDCNPTRAPEVFRAIAASRIGSL
jgi:hypothetical protein